MLLHKKCFQLDLSSAVEFGVKLENFSHCQEVYVMADDYEIPLRLVLTDDLAGRSMELLVSIRKGVGGAIKVCLDSMGKNLLVLYISSYSHKNMEK